VAKPKNTAATTVPTMDRLAIAASGHRFRINGMERCALRALSFFVGACGADAEIRLLDIHVAIRNYLSTCFLHQDGDCHRGKVKTWGVKVFEAQETCRRARQSSESWQRSGWRGSSVKLEIFLSVLNGEVAPAVT
jgi:hypothetical protein